MQNLVRTTLALGERRTRAVDIGAGPGVGAIEKEDARPEVNGFLIPALEVLLETGDEKSFRATVAVDGFVLRQRAHPARIWHVGLPGRLYR